MGIAIVINDTVANAIDDFASSMQTRGNAAWRKVAINIRNLDVDDRGKLYGSEFNTETATDISFELLATIQSPKFDEAMTHMKNTLNPLREQVEMFYEDRFGAAPYEVVRLSRGLVSSTENDIDNNIGEAGFDVNVIQPASNALREHIKNKSTIEATIKDMEHRIKDRIKTFTDIKATTLMQQFGNRLNDLFGRVYSKVAKYSGPISPTALNPETTPRHFCKWVLKEQPKGGYTEDAIKDLPRKYKEKFSGELNSKGDWKGAIPNTDRGSIFVNRGGYRCRHSFEWI